jgi:hypothetical protein
MQSESVDEADTPEGLCKNALLFVGRRELIFVGSLRLAHGLFDLALFLDMLLESSQNLSIERPIVLFSCLPHLFQKMSGKSDSKRLLTIFQSCIL